MNAVEAKEILDKVVGQVFGYQNPLSLDQAMERFAFDLRLPQKVYDSTSNEPTWASSVNPTQFMKMDNARARNEVDDWMLPPRKLDNLQDVIKAWQETNYTSTERQIDSINIAESDAIYNSENVYRSSDVTASKNVLFCDSVQKSEFIVASQRSQMNSFCIRAEDSKECSNSFNVIWSGSITNCLFIQDSFDLFECMLCSHIASKQYCIANMQFEKEEYFRLKKEVIRWILTGQ